MYTGGEGGGEGEESSIEDLTGFMGSSELLALWNSIQYQITENKLQANFSGQYNMLSQLTNIHQLLPRMEKQPEVTTPTQSTDKISTGAH